MSDLDTSKPFTRAQGRASGLSWRRLAGSEFRRLFHDVYVAARACGPDVLARAAVTAVGDHALVSHHTAAQLWGGVVPHVPMVHLTVPKGHTRAQRDGIEVHAADRPAAVVKDIRVTTAAATFVDMARYLSLVDLVVLGDSLVKGGVTTLEALKAAARGHRGRGARLARRAAGCVRADVDSPMESRARMLMVLAGLPEPVVNHALRDVHGTVRRRLDLSYPAHRLAIEYDGRQHAENSAQWRSDIARREELDSAGWRLVVLLSDDLFRTPEQTLRRICAAMRDCGMAVPRLREEWRRHFPEA